MKFEEIYEKTVYAFEHNEVIDLLVGKKGYSYQSPTVPFSIPTCDEFVFRNGIYPYYNSVDDKQKNVVRQKLVSAIDKIMASSDVSMTWWALSILHGQKDYEEYFKASPFKIADEGLNKIRPILLDRKVQLSENFDFVGANNPVGLWGDVIRINSLLVADYQISVL